MIKLVIHILSALALTFATLFIPASGVYAEENQTEEVVPSLPPESELPDLSPAPPTWKPSQKSSDSTTSQPSFHLKAPSIWVSRMDETSVTLNWTRGAYFYELQKWDESSETWETIYRGEVANFTLFDVPRDSFTFFRVAGWDGTWSPWSFQSGYLATYNYARYSGTQNTVELNAMSDNNVLTTSSGSNFAYVKWINENWVSVYASDEPVFTDSDTQSNEESYYAMFARNSGEWRALNGYGFIRANTPPAKPENLKVNLTSSSIELTWSPVSGEPLDDPSITYHVYLNEKPVGKTKETSYTFSDLNLDDENIVGVLAENSLYAKSDLSTVTGTTSNLKKYEYIYEGNRLKRIVEDGVDIVVFEYDENGNLTVKKILK
ncbi:fibronectin type III domain-containing protein [Brevibacillus sp. SYSU BS000544]|uniref:fibronectin type III domain-containing protein n=1 Tax=Brevibacillus sp. SYSU BS000544 TaxID=3416443 RepID=UPI003CE56845